MIREATRQDIPALVEMMRCYAKEAPMEALQLDENHDAGHVSHLLFSLIVGRGFILVDDEFKGMLAAIKTRNVWCPGVIELRELAWWVKPEFRNGSIGGRLWKTFEQKAQTMLEEKKVDYICTTVMVNSPLIDYTKRGFKPLDVTFYRD